MIQHLQCGLIRLEKVKFISFFDVNIPGNSLSDIINKCLRLKCLRLQEKSLGFTESVISKIDRNVLHGLERLGLVLQGDLKWLPCLQKHCQNLVSMNVSMDIATTEIVNFFESLTKNNRKLTELNIRCKDQKENAFPAALLTSIATYCPHMAILRLCAVDTGLNVITNLLIKCPKLDKLRLKIFNGQSTSLIEWGMVESFGSRLELCDLRASSVDLGKFFSALCTLLVCCFPMLPANKTNKQTGLREIVLVDIGHYNFKAIRQLVHSHTDTLTQLNLSGCDQIRSEQYVTLFSPMVHLRKLEIKACATLDCTTVLHRLKSTLYLNLLALIQCEKMGGREEKENLRRDIKRQFPTIRAVCVY